LPLVLAKEAANCDAFKQTQQILSSSDYQGNTNIRNEVKKRNLARYKPEMKSKIAIAKAAFSTKIFSPEAYLILKNKLYAIV
jgi:hypothetical protein